MKFHPKTNMLRDFFVALFLLKLPYAESLESSIHGNVENSTHEVVLYDDSLNDMYEAENNCTNDYCVSDEDYLNLIVAHISPHFLDFVLIAMHSVVFTVGLVGNSLVCIAVYRNHTMRTVTNYFIVNLAVADLLVILFCLPSTVLWDITDTWFLGLKLCKAILYFQTVSVTVSVSTLTFISVDRWYAICFPLRFKSTTTRAKKAIFVIWFFALLYDIPELIVLQTFPSKQIRIKTIFYTQCAHSWSPESQKIFTCITLVFLYFGPLIFMTVAYYQIVRVLWRSNIPGHNLSARIYQANEVSATAVGNPEGQLRSRRKAAKMLGAVVLMFAFCYLPVHLLSILRQVMNLPSGQLTRTFSLLAHWLCYANSAVNPVIYNFMSGKFRKEFKRAFCCASSRRNDHRGVYKFTGTSDLASRRSQMLTRSINTTTNKNLRQSVELIPLGSIMNVEQIDKRD
ncbi:orexin receptor type 2-like [Venturia canescens]|uniref:orexin receptor type 2-like n=1 Tax=Venturia canescens TaxID=32260 RepID=UPI001C9C2A3D|nr:orexin receptor type 2-like [Venturia canescens]XP_043267127.1 orexin receptor type 2-like [Venturia canescens]